jgi:hypothetical protein
MTSRLLLSLVAALGLSTALSTAAWAGSGRVPAADPAKPAEAKPAEAKPAEIKTTETKIPDAKRAPLPPPIVFFVAKGDANACGSGCGEWIAAEGTIDTGAEDRLRALLRRLGGRKLPIYFHSPGGSVGSGLAIGRLMRERGLTAGVGWTVPAGCDPQQSREPACDKLKRSGRDLVAVLDTGRAMCNSSCVYALVGAAVRDVGAGIKLGIHSSSISFSLNRTDPSGHVTRTPAHVAAGVERQALQGGYERIGAYLREMGIAPGLLTAAREVANDHLRFLTREEIVAFGIDRREQVEGTWWFVDKSAGGSAVKVIEAKVPEAGAFRRTILRLTCRNPLTLRLQYGREVGAEKASLPVRLRVTAGGSNFPLGRGVTVSQSDSRLPMEVYSADLPISVLGNGALVIEAAGSSGPSPDPTATDGPSRRLTAQSMGPGLGELARHCNAAPPSDHEVPAAYGRT